MGQANVTCSATLCTAGDGSICTAGNGNICQAWDTEETAVVRPMIGAHLRGMMEIEGTTAVGAATRLALAEALAAVLHRHGPEARVEVARSTARIDAKPDALRFDYSIHLGDLATMPAARQVLEREIETGGRRRLLAHFAKSLNAHDEPAAKASVASHGLRVVDWTVEACLPITKARRLSSPHKVTPSLSVHTMMV
mmetsp:Transcript_32314/g.57176  ORF Transcript_32314/g.57176 Transcript_32314/m.57176 type:complete len:196 (-) Transcript_32314:14-601(-)